MLLIIYIALSSKKDIVQFGGKSQVYYDANYYPGIGINKHFLNIFPFKHTLPYRIIQKLVLNICCCQNCFLMYLYNNWNL